MDEDVPVERVIVFVDGNNLYHRLKERGWPTWNNIGKLAERIVGPHRKLVHIYYYNAHPPGGKSHTTKGNEYLAEVQRTPNLTFRRAWLQPTSKVDEYGSYPSYREKGADTSLSTDLTALAADDEMDVVVIVSSDGDFAPAATIAHDKYGKAVEVIYFEGSRPFAMESCSLMRQFRQSFLVECDHNRSNRPASPKHSIDHVNIARD